MTWLTAVNLHKENRVGRDQVDGFGLCLFLLLLLPFFGRVPGGRALLALLAFAVSHAQHFLKDARHQLRANGERHFRPLDPDQVIVDDRLANGGPAQSDQPDPRAPCLMSVAVFQAFEQSRRAMGRSKGQNRPRNGPTVWQTRRSAAPGSDPQRRSSSSSSSSSSIVGHPATEQGLAFGPRIVAQNRESRDGDRPEMASVGVHQCMEYRAKAEQLP